MKPCTPRGYLSLWDGLNGMSQQYHRFLRDEIIRFPEQKPPVHLNTWEVVPFENSNT